MTRTLTGWDESRVAILQETTGYDIGSHGVLIIEENIVRYYSFGGQLLKQYTCECIPIQAIFHSIENSQESMVVILVSSTLVRIFTETGEFFDIPLSFIASRLFSSSKGIIIESECNTCRNLVEDSIISMHYVIFRPDAPYLPLYHPQQDGKILTVCGSLIASLEKKNDKNKEKNIVISSINSHEQNKELFHSAFKNNSKLSDSFSSTRHSTPANKNKRSRKTKTSNKFPTTSPESFATALGIPGFVENRSVSPLSFARIREIDLERQNVRSMPISMPMPIPISMMMSPEVTLDNGLSNDHSMSMSMSLDQSTYSYQEGNSCFVRNDLAVISIEDFESPPEVSFSQDPSGATLIHLLSPQGTLHTYCLPQISTTKDHKTLLTPVRILKDVISICHFYLGTAPPTLDTKLPLQDIFGTLIVHKEEEDEMNKVDLVLGLSQPICSYFSINLNDFNQQQQEQQLYPFRFCSNHSSGIKKSRPGVVFLLVEGEDSITLHLHSISKWSWLSCRTQSDPLRGSISHKFLEVLLSAVCRITNNIKSPTSTLAASCLLFLLQTELTEDSSSLLPFQILITLSTPFLSSLADCGEDLTNLLTYLLPSFSVSRSLQIFINILNDQNTIHLNQLHHFSLILFQTIHLALEDLFLQETTIGSITHQLIASLYLASSIFQPSFKNYYRRILSTSPFFSSSIDNFIPICDRLGLYLKTNGIQEEPLSITSSFDWIANTLSSFEISREQLHDRQLDLWSPFMRNISFIVNHFSECQDQFDPDVIKMSISLQNMLCPAIVLIRHLLLSLKQVITWFQNNQNSPSSTAFCLAFLCVCHRYPSLQEQDILLLFPTAIRIAIHRSLLSHRDDLESLQVYWIHFNQTQTQHCGYCYLNQSNWPLCPQCPTSHSSTCSCQNIFPSIQPKSFNLPRRILIFLGREDFIANQEGRLPVKERYQLTDRCLLGTFPNLARGVTNCSEELDYFVNDKNTVEGPHSSLSSTSSTRISVDDQDGLIDVEKSSYSRFSEDERIHEVCRMLRSSKTIYLKVERTPEMTDAIYRQKQQTKLLSLCRRTLASAVGRGMLTLDSLNPILAEPIPIPPIILLGRCPPTNATISLDTISPEMTVWPEYHNGVAAGLRIKRTGVVSRNWILYNRIHALNLSDTASTLAAENRHAGFLLSLGLQGHLKVLSIADICDYLTRGHELTTISMLIGLAASRIGSADPLLSKSLCLHLPTLMYPVEAGEIDISPYIQTAAVVGLGLLHCSSANRLIIEYLLTELVSPHSSLSQAVVGPLQDTKEAISLSTGWSLGMLLLGMGRLKSENNGQLNLDIHDLRVEDRLQQCIDGGLKYQESQYPMNSARTKPIDASKSSRILEGNYINTNVTTPGAVIALTLIYLRSNNHDIASHIEVPHTIFALDNVRPDLLIFRAMGSSLVLWDELEPTVDWLRKKIPKIILELFFTSKQDEEIQLDSDFNLTQMNVRAAFQVLLCLLSGFCWGMSLRYAGTSDIQAKAVGLKLLRFLQCLRDGYTPSWDSLEFVYQQEVWEQENESLKLLIKSQRQKILKLRLRKLMLAAGEKASRAILEMCLTLTALSVSMICSGSGDLEVLRILRALHSKVDDITFGTHMGISMATGLLFLAQGKASLRRDDISIASLILSTCPRYPFRSKDNQSHLQALRQLYVLAVEERCLQAVYVDSDESSPLDVEVTLKTGMKMQLRIPNLLPELSSINSVKSLSQQHFPALIGVPDSHFSANWDNTINCCSCSLHYPSIPHTPLNFPLFPTLFIKKLLPESTRGGQLTNPFVNQNVSSHPHEKNHSCLLSKRVFLESQTLYSVLLSGLKNWTHSLCLEVNLLRILLRTFPFFRNCGSIVDDLNLLKSTGQNFHSEYSLTRLLSTADSILATECSQFIKRANTTPEDFFDQLISGSGNDSRYSSISFAFGLNSIDLYPEMRIGNDLAAAAGAAIVREQQHHHHQQDQIQDQNQEEREDKGGEMELEHLVLSLLNRVSLAINNNTPHNVHNNGINETK